MAANLLPNVVVCHSSCFGINPTWIPAFLDKSLCYHSGGAHLAHLADTTEVEDVVVCRAEDSGPAVGTVEVESPVPGPRNGAHIHSSPSDVEPTKNSSCKTVLGMAFPRTFDALHSNP